MPKAVIQSLMAFALSFASCVVLAAPKLVSGRLVTEDGFTLYVFDNDVRESGKSACIAACENIFPPYLAKKGETAKEPWALISRDGDKLQWTYKGRPLYRFYADDKKGAIGGDGLNRNVWHVARP